MSTFAQAPDTGVTKGSPATPIRLSITTRQVALVLLTCIAGLVLMDIFSIYLKTQGETLSWKMGVLADRFQMDEEASVPTWAASVLLAFNAMLLLLTAFASRHAGDGRALHWAGLAAIIALLSIEEVAQFHEALGAALRHRFDTKGVLHFAWTIPGSIFALLVLLTYARFLLRLPGRYSLRIMISGGIYVLGAIIAEMAGSYIVSARIADGTSISETQYLFVVLLEETLETAGQALFAWTLVDYLSVRGLQIDFGCRRA
ncbi:hypothetical protein OEW28_14490 [Defluviimonas sp. WL0002]|uniref:Multidrug transporter n=1 Tax=Albidovulum marisflavi TaxID=2984159 RepID=A0ABT2ZFG3_9RHOB|nr:hypothetical protein [Defluviimonas sp. WL0002]MCV2869841.1 hypothetical protein [Defluviimonas sp. WL0002]